MTILQDGAKASVQEDSMCSCSSGGHEADRVKWDNRLHGVCIQAAFGVCAHVCTLPAISVLVHGQTTQTIRAPCCRLD